MEDKTDTKLLLGKHTPVVEHYAPELLYPIPRSKARDNIGVSEPLPFNGVDIWHAYEMSWLEPTGKPVARVGRFTIPITSPFMVESKSFKLYLNSLNNVRFADDAEASKTIVADISAIAGEPIDLCLWHPDDPAVGGTALSGVCIDPLPVAGHEDQPRAEILTCTRGNSVEEQVYSHLLRSLCPVTGQPDWATVWIHYRGPAIDHGSLLSYIIAYRQHQEYHEQCVERMYRDIQQVCSPQLLQIQAFYTRRGGLDITPYRSSSPEYSALGRLNRQ